MGNCFRSPASVAREDICHRINNPKNPRKNPPKSTSDGVGAKSTTVLPDVPNQSIDGKYLINRELGRGEFGVTYLCVEKTTLELFACKTISKRKLRTAVDVDDVRREVAIMKHLPKCASIVRFKEAYEDESGVHLVMELCEGGELFDRIVVRGHYT